MSDKKTITAVFSNRIEAETAIRKLEHAGFTEKEVNLLVTEETHKKDFGLKESTKAEEGAVAGATVGGLAGALYLSMASAGALLIPGFNLVVGGALIGGLVGLGAGAATGGFVGALVGMGIPEHEAVLYEEALRKGSVLVAVESKDDDTTALVERIFEDANAKDVMSLAA